MALDCTPANKMQSCPDPCEGGGEIIIDESGIFFGQELEFQADPMVGRDGAAAFQLGQFLYIAGGWNGTLTPSTNNEVWRAPVDDPTNWTQIADADWYRRHTFGWGVINNVVYIWGRDIYSQSFANDIWQGVADASGDITWISLGALPYAERSLFAWASDGERYLWTIGGLLYKNRLHALMFN